MTSTPLPWIAEPVDTEESHEILKEERDDWVAIIGNVRLKAGRVEDEIWRSRGFENVALCRRENASLLLTAPKLLIACKLLLGITPDAARVDGNARAACAKAREAIAEAEGEPVTDSTALRAAGYEIKPDPDAPGKWMWRNHVYDAACDGSFDSEIEAWRDAGKNYVKGI